MSSWKETNRRIRSCRDEADPLRCLRRLFDETTDGHVAFALGEELERRDCESEAIAWYQRAERLYPYEKFKTRARAALTRLRPETSSPLADAEPDTASLDALRHDGSSRTLYVVSCTKRKIWDKHDPKIPRFVPARRAYLGRSFTKWLASPLGRSAKRWVILSARYGFIDPDQPIEKYDVTFSEPSTGPLTNDALRAQVAHQRRWSDEVALKDFRLVRVHGSSEYLERVRLAFGPDADVELLESLESERRDQRDGHPNTDTPGEPPEPHHTEPANTGSKSFDEERARRIGDALGRLDDHVYVAIDRGEPEWSVFERIAALEPSVQLLIAVALGLTDYQLTAGGAAQYWRDVTAELDAGAPSEPPDIAAFMSRVIDRPASRRLADQKRARVTRLLDSPLAVELPNRTIADVGRDPMSVWSKLASTMGASPQTKTVAFSMKLLDLLHLIVTSGYIRFPTVVPIVADLRIARMTLASGLMAPLGRVGVQSAMADVQPFLDEYHERILAAWGQVGTAAGGRSLFRIDSLVWQVAQPVYEHRFEPRLARQTVSDVVAGYGASTDDAVDTALELTFALAGGTSN